MYVFKRFHSHRPADADDPLPPGYYAKSLAPDRVKGGWAIVRCPRCEKLSTVGINHMVDSAGNIRPSYVCPFAGCSFHVFARLDDWRAGDAV